MGRGRGILDSSKRFQVRIQLCYLSDQEFNSFLQILWCHRDSLLLVMTWLRTHFYWNTSKNSDSSVKTQQDASLFPGLLRRAARLLLYLLKFSMIKKTVKPGFSIQEVSSILKMVRK